MKISINSFAGEMPRVDGRLLPTENAEFCANARMERGHLSPMRLDTPVLTLGAAAETIYRHAGTWLSFPVDADCVPGPVDADRLYVTRADQVPQVYTTATGFRVLALSPPVAAPTLALGAGTVDPVLSEEILYCFTYVSNLGEETRPSPSSAPITWSPGINVTVSMPVVPTNPPFIYKRVYRSVTSITGVTDFYFVAEVTAATTSYVHDFNAAPPNEALPSVDYDAPPINLRGLTAMPNGIMAGFAGRKLYFCEPYKPHAWPEKYSLTTNDEIVGLSAFGTSLAVMTKGSPYPVQGLTPDTMAMSKIEVDLPCVSKRGIVDLGYAAVFPSTRGLAQITNQGAQLVSEGVWTRDQWVALNPSSIVAAQANGRYVFSYSPTGTRLLTVIDLNNQAPFISPVNDKQYRDLFYDPQTSQTFGLDLAGLQISEFDPAAGILRSAQWRSKTFAFPVPVSFGVLNVEATLPPAGNTAAFLIEVFADGAVLATYGANSPLMRPPQGEFFTWAVRYAGNHTIHRIILCGTPEELLS